MIWEEVVSGCFIIVLALAFSTGFAHKLYRGFSARRRRNDSGSRAVSFVEMWECSFCHRLNSIGHSCKQCGNPMPAHPRFLTVSESHLTKRLQTSDHPDRHSPPRGA